MSQQKFNSKILHGTVKFFNYKKGWGIICCKNKSFFVHHKDIVDSRFKPKDKPIKFRTLNEGQLVSFIPKQTTKPLNMATLVVIRDDKNK